MALTAVLIVLVVVAAVVAVAAIGFALVQRATRASRGGVEPRSGEFRRGNPPFESFGRRR